MSKKTILIVAKGCPGCEKAKQDLARQNTDVEVLDVTTDLKAARLIRDLGVYKVPLVVTIEKSEHGTEICTLDNNRVKCVNSSDEESE